MTQEDLKYERQHDNQPKYNDTGRGWYGTVSFSKGSKRKEKDRYFENKTSVTVIAHNNQPVQLKNTTRASNKNKKRIMDRYDGTVSCFLLQLCYKTIF